MQEPVITVIGAGNMGRSLIGGLIKNNYPPHKLCAIDPHIQKLHELEASFSISTSTSFEEVISKSNILLFAIKPQLFREVILDIKSLIQTYTPLIISIAAGITTQSIHHWIGQDIAIVRAMPNIAALIGHSATGLYANSFVSLEQVKIAEKILKSVGITAWLTEEKQLDIITALSGSGPAYFFLFMSCLEKSAIQQGLSKELSHLFTMQTTLGAAHMALENTLSFDAMREQVTSTGGTTEAAINVMQENHIASIIDDAVNAAIKRAHTLAQSLKT